MKGRSAAVALLSLALLFVAALVGPSLEGERGAFIFWELRVPRVLVGALVGGTLSLVGACFQTLFANPLATESTVGTTAGATLGALSALALELPASGTYPVLFVAAFAGALLASFSVALVASSGRARLGDVLLAGITVTLATGALSTGLQYISESHALIDAARWSLGALPQVGYAGVLLLLPVVVPVWIALLLLARALSTFAFGEELAHARGVNVRRLRFLVLGFGSLAVAASVAWCGPIAFVGLIVPHLVRLAVGPALGRLLPLSLLSGAAFLVACDALARSVVPGRELPVGVVTATVGAPSLVVLLFRARPR
ncbi:MAG TPA: iron ABC transporter permease [Polyangiaceae bacterium]